MKGGRREREGEDRIGEVTERERERGGGRESEPP